MKEDLKLKTVKKKYIMKMPFNMHISPVTLKIFKTSRNKVD